MWITLTTFLIYSCGGRKVLVDYLDLKWLERSWFNLKFNPLADTRNIKIGPLLDAYRSTFYILYMYACLSVFLSVSEPVCLSEVNEELPSNQPTSDWYKCIPGRMRKKLPSELIFLHLQNDLAYVKRINRSCTVSPLTILRIIGASYLPVHFKNQRKSEFLVEINLLQRSALVRDFKFPK